MNPKIIEFQILLNAVELGFDQELIMDEMDAQIFDFAATLDIKEVYPHLFEKVVQYAESWICKHQVVPFIKEVYIDLVYRRCFHYYRSDGGCCYVDGVELIDWEQHKDCRDDKQIFFYSALDSDLKTVLKFFDYGAKTHQC